MVEATRRLDRGQGRGVAPRYAYSLLIRERAAIYFPFGIAVALPPAGFILGLAAYSEGKHDLGMRIMVTAAVAAVIWVTLLI
jgi:hypothetical protein